jgi:hypothetical protein
MKRHIFYGLVAVTLLLPLALNSPRATILPAGIIVLWSGPADHVPAGWCPCDGTKGTPDLRDRFLVGAGGRFSPGDTGGAETINIAHTHDSDTIETDINNHSHGFGTLATDNDAHAHGPGTLATGLSPTLHTIGEGNSESITLSHQYHVHGISRGMTAGDNHDHNVDSGATASDSHSHRVDIDDDSIISTLSETQSILPPYYALTYIQLCDPAAVAPAAWLHLPQIQRRGLVGGD